MFFVAVSYYPERRASLPKGWEVWETDQPIPQTYAQIATHAVAERWDRDVMVVQDDVRLLETPESDAELIVYGQGNNEHVCPRAFAASRGIWKELSRRWQPWTGQICHAWKPVVDKWGEVLNVTKHGVTDGLI